MGVLNYIQQKGEEMVDLNQLKIFMQAYLKTTGKKLTYVLKKAKIPRANYYNRLNGKGEFTASEMYGLKMATEMSEEDFRNIFFANAAE